MLVHQHRTHTQAELAILVATTHRWDHFVRVIVAPPMASQLNTYNTMSKCFWPGENGEALYICKFCVEMLPQICQASTHQEDSIASEEDSELPSKLTSPSCSLEHPFSAYCAQSENGDDISKMAHIQSKFSENSNLLRLQIHIAELEANIASITTEYRQQQDKIQVIDEKLRDMSIVDCTIAIAATKIYEIATTESQIDKYPHHYTDTHVALITVIIVLMFNAMRT